MGVEKLRQIWRTLTEAVPSVTDPETRHHVRFLNSLLVGLLPIGLLVACLPELLDAAQQPLQDNDFIILLAATALWAGSYALAKRGHYLLATITMSVIASAAIVIIVITDGNCEDIHYLIIPITLSSVIVSPRATAWLAGSMLLIAALLPWGPVDLRTPLRHYYTGPFTFLAIGSFLVLALVQHQNQLAQGRQDKLRDHSTTLERQAEELARSNAFLTALSQVVARLVSVRDRDTIMATTGQELRALGLRAMVALLEPDRESLVICYTSIDTPLIQAAQRLTGMSMVGFRVPRDKLGVWDAVMENGEAVYTTEGISLMTAAVPERWGAMLTSFLRSRPNHGKNRVLWLPLLIEKQVIGTLTVWGPTLRREDAETFRIFAAQVATASENSRLYLAARDRAEQLERTGEQLRKELAERQRAEHTLQRYARRLRTLYEINQAIIAAESPRTIAEAALKPISQLIPCDQAALLTIDIEHKQVVFLRIIPGLDLPSVQDGTCMNLLTLENSDLTSTLLEGQVGHVTDFEAIAKLHPLLAQVHAHSGLQSALLVPLLVREQIIGILALSTGKKDAPGADATSIAQEIADSLAVALQQSRLQKERQQHAERLEAALHDKEALLREIHHRVKNNLQIISSLLSLGADHTDDQHTITQLEASRSRVQSMALVHEQLYQSPDLAQVDLHEYIERLSAHLFHAYGAYGAGITLHIDVDSVPLDIDTAVPCGLIINEIMTNALKYAFPNSHRGDIHIQVQREGQRVNLEISDNGVGLPPDLDIERVDSMGMQLISTLTAQLQGTLDVDRTNGTAYTIRFPVSQGERGADL